MPLREDMEPRNSDVHLDAGSIVKDLEDQLDLEEKKEEDDLLPPEHRDESERREAVYKVIDNMKTFKTEEAVQRFLDGLETMPLTELQKLKDDDQYRNDTMFSMQVIM